MRKRWSEQASLSDGSMGPMFCLLKTSGPEGEVRSHSIGLTDLGIVNAVQGSVNLDAIVVRLMVGTASH